MKFNQNSGDSSLFGIRIMKAQLHTQNIIASKKRIGIALQKVDVEGHQYRKEGAFVKRSSTHPGMYSILVFIYINAHR